MTDFIYIIYYHLFRFDKWTQRIISTPFVWFMRRPKIKNIYRKLGRNNIEKEIYQTFYDPKTSISAVFADRHLTVLFIIFYLGIAGFLVGTFWKELDDVKYVFILIGVLSFITTEYFISWGNKYLPYVRKFERKSTVWRRKTGILSFFAILGVWCFGIGGAVFYGYRHSL